MTENHEEVKVVRKGHVLEITLDRPKVNTIDDATSRRLRQAFVWTRLLAPELTRELRDRMVEGCERQAGGTDFAELSRKMNHGLVAIMRALGKPAGSESDS